jgi:hypothetical protein
VVRADAALVVPACWLTIAPVMATNPATLATVAPFFQALRRRKVSAFACCAGLGAFCVRIVCALVFCAGSGVDMWLDPLALEIWLAALWASYERWYWRTLLSRRTGR